MMCEYYTSPRPAREKQRIADLAVAVEERDSARALAEAEEAETGQSVQEHTAARLATAEANVTKLEEVANFPVNFVFSPDGAQVFNTLAVLWMEDNPHHHQINDDVKNMYNETSRVACFRAARLHRPSRIPYLRLFYGHHAPIYIVRAEGRMVSVAALSGTTAEDDVTRRLSTSIAWKRSIPT